MDRKGDSSPYVRGKTFLSQQTQEGLKISIYSHTVAIKFLLGNGLEYVLTERLMQNVLEDYFGHQRAKGHMSDSPSAHEFGYGDLTIGV